MKKVIFIAVLMVLKLLPVSGQSEWTFKTEKDGIKIYTSLMPDSKIKAIKVIGDFNATPNQLAGSFNYGCKYFSAMGLSFKVELGS